MYQLYGDGIHDDYPAIQEMIDSGVCEVCLPAPKKFYLITQTLVIPSNFRLVLPRFAEIRLADGANCLMLRNRWVEDHAERIADHHRDSYKKFYYYVNEISPAPEHACENFEVIGGIWNINNQNQKPNPNLKKTDDQAYVGHGLMFYNVKHFKIASLTLKDPTNYAVTIDMGSYFTVEDITFDFNLGNPTPPGNMDGIHLNGNCHFGVIRNLKGACYDDLVALNATEGSAGPITHIEIDSIFAEECHSAVRMLCSTEELSHVHITNVHGTYYQYCIALSKFYPSETTVGYDCISIDHIYASKAVRHPYLYPWSSSYVYALIWIERDSVVKHLTIQAVHRREHNVPIETIYVGKNTEIGDLILRDITTENHTEQPMPLLVNQGHIKHLSMSLVRSGDDIRLDDQGTIDRVDDDAR